jgi:hypothetical protein
MKNGQKPPENRRVGAPKGSENHKIHGHYQRKVLLKDVQLLDISRQNKLGRVVIEQAEAIYQDGGGKEQFSELKQHLVSRYLITELMIQSVDRWLLEQPSLINRAKRCIFPIVSERNRLVSVSLQLAQAIGLERKQKPVHTLESYIQEQEQKKP